MHGRSKSILDSKAETVFHCTFAVLIYTKFLEYKSHWKHVLGLFLDFLTGPKMIFNIFEDDNEKFKSVWRCGEYEGTCQQNGWVDVSTADHASPQRTSILKITHGQKSFLRAWISNWAVPEKNILYIDTLKGAVSFSHATFTQRQQRPVDQVQVQGQ